MQQPESGGWNVEQGRVASASRKFQRKSHAKMQEQDRQKEKGSERKAVNYLVQTVPFGRKPIEINYKGGQADNVKMERPRKTASSQNHEHAYSEMEKGQYDAQGIGACHEPLGAYLHGYVSRRGIWSLQSVCRRRIRAEPI